MSFDFTTTCVNDTVRRQDRTADAETARRLLEEGEYGFLSLQAEEGGGYGLPISFVWDGEQGAVYMHCAPEGRKLRCLTAEPRASFCVVGHTQVEPAHFTTRYESVMLHGLVHVVTSEAERCEALRLLVDKYAPEYTELGQRYAQGSLHRACLLRLDAAAWSAKAKRSTAPRPAVS